MSFAITKLFNPFKFVQVKKVTVSYELGLDSAVARRYQFNDTKVKSSCVHYTVNSVQLHLTANVAFINSSLQVDIVATPPPPPTPVQQQRKTRGSFNFEIFFFSSSWSFCLRIPQPLTGRRRTTRLWVGRITTRQPSHGPRRRKRRRDPLLER